MFLRTQFWKSLLNYFEQKHGKVESLKITSAILSKLKGVYLFFLATVKLKLNKGFFNQRLILVLKNIFSMWSDGVLFAFNQAEVPNVRGKQIDFNYATSQQQIYMKGS